MATSSEKLIELLGGVDPAKETLTKDVLTEALDELKKERAEKAKKDAKEQLAKAIDLHTQAVKEKQAFDQKYAKFQKDLGKVVNKLHAMANGQAPPPEENNNEGGGE